ncbi:MAG: 3D domain-containing protein [Verrucomicrobiota bacterium]
MRSDTPHFPFWMLASGALLALPLTSCTTTSNLASLSAQSAAPVEAAIAGTTPIELVGEEATANDLQPDAPAIADPVAQPKPVQAGPPIVLTSVPNTSVETRPTNQIMMIRTTAYSHLQADSLPYGRKSAAGNNLMYGSEFRSAAADWSKYPLGTKFKIEGLPYTYVVDDYGSALCGTETIDIYKPDLAGIGRWGVRNLPVRVLEWGSFEESANILRGRTHVKHAHHVRTMLREIEKKGKAGYLSKPSGGSA